MKALPHSPIFAREERRRRHGEGAEAIFIYFFAFWISALVALAMWVL